MDITLEVLTARRSRREAHRQWPDDVKDVQTCRGLPRSPSAVSAGQGSLLAPVIPMVRSREAFLRYGSP